MAILGDIIEIHHRRRHPRFGGLDDAHSVAVVAKMLADFEYSLEGLSTESAIRGYSSAPVIALNGNGGPIPNSSSFSTDQAKARLVKAYSTHILHVLHVLLHGKWDALSMLDDGDDWITSDHFTKCASHAVMASQSVSTILTIDPELTFMSYLFGIYLLQGSFILLLFADRMPQLGPNESVEQACETIIRAHEVCVVTLSTEFQVSPANSDFLFDVYAELTLLNRKTSAKWFDQHYTAFVVPARPTGRSTEQDAERSHSTDGPKVQKDLLFNPSMVVRTTLFYSSCIYPFF